MDRDLLNNLDQIFTRYTRDRYHSEQWREYGKTPLGFETELMQEMGELGWFMLGIPEELGGSGQAITDLLPLLNAVGAGLWREPILPLLGGAVGALLAVPEHPESPSLIEQIISGKTLVGLAHAEFARGIMSDRVETTASKSGHTYLINGDKTFLVAAPACGWFLVTARHPESDESDLFLVAAKDPSVTLASYRTVDDRSAADVNFNNAPARLLGNGAAAILGARRRMSILAAAEALGIIQKLNQDTRHFVTERRQFGRPLASFQVLQHRLVDMHILEQETAALLLSVANDFDRSAIDIDRRLLILRCQVSRALRFVTQQSIQLHGGMGMSDELMVGHFYKRALLLESLCGSADWAIGQLVDYTSDVEIN